MNQERFYFQQMQERKKLLTDLEALWLRLELLKVLEPEDSYWARLADTCEELIIRQQDRLIRKYVL